MKEITEKKEVWIRRNICTRLVCDICGKACDQPADSYWYGDYGNTLTAKLEYTDRYGEEDDIGDSLDICPACAKKLIALLRKTGKSIFEEAKP